MPPNAWPNIVAQTALSAVAISSQDIYDEFSHGLMDAEAIAAFIKHAYANWPLQPRYVILLGDDTWDYSEHHRRRPTQRGPQPLLPVSRPRIGAE